MSHAATWQPQSYTMQHRQLNASGQERRIVLCTELMVLGTLPCMHAMTAYQSSTPPATLWRHLTGCPPLPR